MSASLPVQMKPVSYTHLTQTVPIDVRLICATNADIRQMVEDGNFRQDLLYRINTIEDVYKRQQERQNDYNQKI